WVMTGPVALDYRASIAGWQYAIHLIIGAAWIIATVLTRSTSLAEGASGRGEEDVSSGTSQFAPWGFASSVAAILIARCVIWSADVPFRSRLVDNAGMAPPGTDNQVAQGVKPATLPA